MSGFLIDSLKVWSFLCPFIWKHIVFKKIEEIWEGHSHRTFRVGMLLSDEMVPRLNYAWTGYCIYNSDSWRQANFWQFPWYAVVFQKDKKNLPDRCFLHLWRVSLFFFFCFRFSSFYYFLYQLIIISVIRSYSSCFPCSSSSVLQPSIILLLLLFPFMTCFFFSVVG